MVGLLVAGAVVACVHALRRRDRRLLAVSLILAVAAAWEARQ